MNCRECRDNLTEFIDGRLNEANQSRVEDHVQTCADCAGELEKIRQLVQTLQGLPAIQSPDGLLDEHRREFRKELHATASTGDAGGARPLWQVLGPVRMAAAFAAVMFASYVVWQSQGYRIGGEKSQLPSALEETVASGDENPAAAGADKGLSVETAKDRQFYSFEKSQNAPRSSGSRVAPKIRPVDVAIINKVAPGKAIDGNPTADVKNLSNFFKGEIPAQVARSLAQRVVDVAGYEGFVVNELAQQNEGLAAETEGLRRQIARELVPETGLRKRSRGQPESKSGKDKTTAGRSAAAVSTPVSAVFVLSGARAEQSIAKVSGLLKCSVEKKEIGVLSQNGSERRIVGHEYVVRLSQDDMDRFLQGLNRDKQVLMGLVTRARRKVPQGDALISGDQTRGRGVKTPKLQSAEDLKREVNQLRRDLQQVLKIQADLRSQNEALRARVDTAGGDDLKKKTGAVSPKVPLVSLHLIVPLR